MRSIGNASLYDCKVFGKANARASDRSVWFLKKAHVLSKWPEATYGTNNNPAHGAGGKQTNDLIGGIFKKYFGQQTPNSGRCGSAATSRQDGDVQDDFIVSPAEFPGGNIEPRYAYGNDLQHGRKATIYLLCRGICSQRKDSLPREF